MIKQLLVIIILPILIFAAEWQSLNGPPAGRADDMSMGWDPLHNYWVIYAADQTHKLYKSTNEGESWQVPTQDERVNNPTCVITQPANAQIVYIGKNDATPVWWSQDGGETWEPRSGTPPNNITNTYPLCFVMDPFDERIIYLGCRRDGDKPVLFRTTDGGFCWEKLNLFNYNINDILVLFFAGEGIVLILGTDKGILRGKVYENFQLVKDGDFKLLKYDKRLQRIFAKGGDEIWWSVDGRHWRVYHSAEPIDFTGLSDIISRRR